MIMTWKEFRDGLVAALHRPSAWITWSITAAVFYVLGHLIGHGWHW